MRVLSAIIFADIQGFSALMGKDEKLANRYRIKFKTTLENNIQEFDGRIIQFYGDGALIIFTSGLNAVEYSIRVQKELQDEPKVPVRIGIHMGDVVIEESGVFGDSVNVTSRIESIAIPGSIFVSDKIHDAISNHIHLKTKSLGKQNFKNVLKEIEIFAVINDGVVDPHGISKEGKLAHEKKSNKFNYILVGAFIIAAVILTVIYFPAKDKSNKQKPPAALSGEEIRKSVSGYLDLLYSTKGSIGDSLIVLSENFKFTGKDDKLNPYSSDYKPESKFNGILSDSIAENFYSCTYTFSGKDDSVIAALEANIIDGRKIKVTGISNVNEIHLTKHVPPQNKENVKTEISDSKDKDVITKEDVKKLRENKLKVRKKILSKKLNN